MVRDYVEEPEDIDDEYAPARKTMETLEFIKEMEKDDGLDEWHLHLIRAFRVMRELARRYWPADGTSLDRTFEERMK